MMIRALSGRWKTSGSRRQPADNLSDSLSPCTTTGTVWFSFLTFLCVCCSHVRCS